MACGNVEIQKADSHISTTHYDLELAIDSRFIEAL
jgi:hypothetical protein